MISLFESLCLLMENQDILCWQCKTGEMVKAEEGCPSHTNTKCEYLVVVALGQISKWYRVKSMVKLTKGITIPFVTMHTGNPNQILPMKLLTGLKLHPLVKLKSPLLLETLLGEISHLELCSLLKILFNHDHSQLTRRTGSSAPCTHFRP